MNVFTLAPLYCLLHPDNIPILLAMIVTLLYIILYGNKMIIMLKLILRLFK